MQIKSSFHYYYPLLNPETEWYFVFQFLLGVRLNKPYSVRIPMDIPVFTGTHADLLIIVSILNFYLNSIPKSR